jgi:hypothetical protein
MGAPKKDDHNKQIPVQSFLLANLSCLYPTYIRGEAYLTAGQGTQAAAEFQKILDRSGIDGTAEREFWHIWAWRERMHCNRRLHKALRPTCTRPGTGRLQRLLNPLERRRPRHPHP